MQLETPVPEVTLYEGDCLAALPRLAAGSVDMVLADLPYGTTYAAWDSVIPLSRLWAELLRVVKGNGAMVFTASQPFTTTLAASNLPLFRYAWVWDKANPTNFANANRQPLKRHEDVLVFARGQTPYFPVKTPGRPNHTQGKNAGKNRSETRLIKDRAGDDPSGMKFPQSILSFPKHSSQCGLHPTQKPVGLFEYLIRTYTRDGDVVLDPAAGSGTTGEAALRCGRRAVLIEQEPKYATVIRERLRPAGLFGGPA